mmetsp:Transcript_29272/g.93828  ORF Transcript_29272/g.93828 Transcript_29272/m.93828 type:complete len:86 (+) Transcript_29272:597-854(+)
MARLREGALATTSYAALPEQAAKLEELEANGAPRHGEAAALLAEARGLAELHDGLMQDVSRQFLKWNARLDAWERAVDERLEAKA